MQYDRETLYLHEMYVSGILLQIAADTIAELVSLTKDASLLEPFFAEILNRDWSDMVRQEPGSKFANPGRRAMALGLLKSRLPEAVGVLRLYAEMSEAECKGTPAN